MLGDPSMKCEFDKVALRYQQLLKSSIEKEHKAGKEMLLKKGNIILIIFRENVRSLHDVTKYTYSVIFTLSVLF